MSLNAVLITNLVLCSVTAAFGTSYHPIERTLPWQSTAITNVHVFDGSKFGPQTTLVIQGGIITSAPPFGAIIVDGKGGYLLPGYIDAHCHITSCTYLTMMRNYGVTTALDMGTFPYSAIQACKVSGVTDIKGSGAAGTVNGSAISHFPGFPSDSFLPNPAAGRQFVLDRIFEGADYIKLFLDPLGPDDATIAAVVQTANSFGKQVISHAPAYADYSQAEAGKVNIPTHVPLDRPIDGPSIANLTSYGAHVVPTLIIMQSIVNNTGAPYIAYTAAAQGSVTNMYKAGIPIVAGTDANTNPFVPANPPFGLSLHEELELLVAAGLSNVDAIRAATSVAASTFRLSDRGVIMPGMRADLVLLRSDPTVDIRNSRTIEKVWVAGIMSTSS